MFPGLTVTTRTGVGRYLSASVSTADRGTRGLSGCAGEAWQVSQNRRRLQPAPSVAYTSIRSAYHRSDSLRRGMFLEDFQESPPPLLCASRRRHFFPEMCLINSAACTSKISCRDWEVGGGRQRYWEACWWERGLMVGIFSLTETGRCRWPVCLRTVRL